MRTALVSSALLAALAGSAYAQQINRINGVPGERHRAEDAALLINGDVALAGEQKADSSLYTNATLTRTGPDGAPIWAFTISGAGSDATGFAVRERPNTDLVLGFHAGYGSNAICLAGVNASGTQLWARRYPGRNGRQAAAIELETKPGGDLVWVAAGYETAGTTGGMLLCANASNGAVVSDRAYFLANAPGGFLTFSDLAIQPGGDIFVIGSGGQFANDAVVARINPGTGTVVWCRTYGLPDSFISTQDYGRGIELTSDGRVAIVIETTDPAVFFGPPCALHVLLNASTGMPEAFSMLPDVQVANASLDRLSTGELLVSGTRTFGGSQTVARMWLLNPTNMNVQWVAEYNDGTTLGADAIEQFVPKHGLILTGSNHPLSIPSFGSSDQMFIKTDLGGDDGCSATISHPQLIVPEVISSAIALVRSNLTTSADYPGSSSLGTLQTAIVCSGSACLGDFNNDNQVDDADFVIFATAYNILDCADPAMPAGCPADLNGDSSVDDTDFVLFAAAYNELVCP